LKEKIILQKRVAKFVQAEYDIVSGGNFYDIVVQNSTKYATGSGQRRLFGPGACVFVSHAQST
jgi:hypothetical protein